ncbi:hypothetical protein [Geodermatophilus ruber]|uniref:Cell division protease FtsH n=1 Tax=Geodermatophilus ruber TaxID=504800 RepID=A0A1I4DYQ3_9ACTN|nr:hypothetical protein [Geodermatophilus ruber]SFK98103.1 cell division protease FtsH [Geodermatophilus ruber]
MTDAPCVAVREHRAQLDALTARLLAAETLDEDEAYAAAGIDRNTAAGARARGEAPEADPAPGLPPPRATPGLTATGGRK